MEIINGCIKLHRHNKQTLVKPHFDDDGYFNITSVEDEWERFSTAIDEWVDVDPTPRCAYIASKLGKMLSQMYNINISQPRPAYNVVKIRGVVPYDGSIAARYLLYMPYKDMFQDAHIDPSWTGLLSLTDEWPINPVFFDMLDTIWAYRGKEHIVDVRIGDTYYGRGISSKIYHGRADGEPTEIKPGDVIEHEMLKFMRFNSSENLGDRPELSAMVRYTPDYDDFQLWVQLFDKIKDSDFSNYAKIWYGADKYDELLQLTKLTKFVVRD